MSKFTHLDLFSGIGGFALAVRWLGGRTVGFCEIDPYCQSVLRRHWPEVPIHPDIRTLGAMAADYPVCECCGEEPWCEFHQMHWGECECFGIQSEELEDVDLITAGFPCQDVSLNSHTHTGVRGERSGLWKEAARVIELVRPRWVLVENVGALVRRGLDTVVRDLAECGYVASWQVLPATVAGASHRRDRVWVIANSESERVQGVWSAWEQVVCSLDRKVLPIRQGNGEWATEPDFRRTPDGLSRGLDARARRRIEALGNAVVPHVAYAVLRAMDFGGDHAA